MCKICFEKRSTLLIILLLETYLSLQFALNYNYIVDIENCFLHLNGSQSHKYYKIYQLNHYDQGKIVMVQSHKC